MTEERDAKVSGAYRELAREEPPAALDRAIGAAAREALNTWPAPLVAPTARRRWYVPLAAAAVLVLAVAVTWHMQLVQPGPDGEEAPAQVPEKDAAASAPAPAAAAPAGEAAAQRTEPMARRGEQGRERVPAAPPPEVPRAAAGPVMRPMAQSGEEARERAQPDAQAARSRERADEPPEKWLERIAELRRAGRHEEAEAELARFRKRYPAYRIPEN